MAYGNKEFNSSLAELKEYFKFELKVLEKIEKISEIDSYKGFLIHEDSLESSFTINLLKNNKLNKVIFYRTKTTHNLHHNEKLVLPTSVDQINNIVMNSLKKREFKTNSSLQINKYVLDKNSRKITKNNQSLELTEKEIELIELLNNKSFTKKKEILSAIWKYSNDADTHTVETHIYRLRKKISKEFGDDNFIRSEKKGYTI